MPRWLWPVVLFALVFAVDVACPSGMTADSIRQVPTAVAIVHFHTISLDRLSGLLINPGVAITRAHGSIYPYFPWGGSLFAVPWLIAYDLAHKVGIGPGSIGLLRTGYDWEIQVLSMSTVVAATAVVVFWTCLRLLRLEPWSRRRRWAALIALAFALTTPAWSTASRSLWEHGPSLFCLSVALLCAVRAQQGAPGWAGMGAALAAAYAMRPTDAIPIIVLGIWMLGWQRRHILPAVLGGVLPAAIFVAVNVASYHQLLSPYYTQGQSFALTTTAFVAAAGNLVSPSRGLLIFVPLVLLSVVGVRLKVRDRSLNSFWVALAAIPVAHWLLISGFKHWWAGDAYGPRLWTDLMPVFVLLALPAVEWLAERKYERQRVVTTLVAIGLAWSFGVQAQGAILRSAWCWNNEPTDVDTHSSKVWSWSDPQFARGLRTLIWGPDRSSELTRDGVDVVGCPVEAVRP